jgi:hypothetical protein
MRNIGKKSENRSIDQTALLLIAEILQKRFFLFTNPMGYAIIYRILVESE